MRDESRLDERRLDEFFKHGAGNLEVLVFLADLRAKIVRAFPAIRRRGLKPICAGFFAHKVFILRAFPRRSEIDRLKDFSISIFVLDDQRPQHPLRDLANHGLHQFHHALIITERLVRFEHRELGIVFAGKAFVAEVTANLINAIYATDKQALEIELQRNSQIKFAAKSVVKGLKWLGRGAAGNGLHHWSLDLDVSPLIQEISNLADDLRPLEKHLLNVRICDQIQITLPVTNLRVSQAVPLLGRRPEGFGQYDERGEFDRDFASFSGKQVAARADEITEVKVAEDIELFVAENILLCIDLQTPALVAHVNKHALAHVAMGGNAAGDCYLAPFDIVAARFRAFLRRREFIFERVNAFCTQRHQLGFALFD